MYRVFYFRLSVGPLISNIFNIVFGQELPRIFFTKILKSSSTKRLSLQQYVLVQRRSNQIFWYQLWTEVVRRCKKNRNFRINLVWKFLDLSHYFGTKYGPFLSTWVRIIGFHVSWPADSEFLEGIRMIWAILAWILDQNLVIFSKKYYPDLNGETDVNLEFFKNRKSIKTKLLFSCGKLRTRAADIYLSGSAQFSLLADVRNFHSAQDVRRKTRRMFFRGYGKKCTYHVYILERALFFARSTQVLSTSVLTAGWIPYIVRSKKYYVREQIFADIPFLRESDVFNDRDFIYTRILSLQYLRRKNYHKLSAHFPPSV